MSFARKTRIPIRILVPCSTHIQSYTLCSFCSEMPVSYTVPTAFAGRPRLRQHSSRTAFSVTLSMQAAVSGLCLCGGTYRPDGPPPLAHTKSSLPAACVHTYPSKRSTHTICIRSPDACLLLRYLYADVLCCSLIDAVQSPRTIKKRNEHLSSFAPPSFLR
jgi:hypothetical protein